MRLSTLIFGFWIFVIYGCADKTPKPKEEKSISIDKNISIIKQKLKNPNTECKDINIKSNSKSNCNRGVISEEELKKSKNRQGGIHTLKSIRGKTIHIIEKPTGFIFPEYKGKVIILEFFGKDCPHCLKEIPIIKRIRKDYRGKLEVIAIQAHDRMIKRSSAYKRKKGFQGHYFNLGINHLEFSQFIRKGPRNWPFGTLTTFLVPKNLIGLGPGFLPIITLGYFKDWWSRKFLP